MTSILCAADGEYMSFGVSGSDSRSVMVGGDVVTAWLERDTGRGFAEDYYLSAKAQCQGGRGACPDAESQVCSLLIPFHSIHISSYAPYEVNCFIYYRQTFDPSQAFQYLLQYLFSRS